MKGAEIIADYLIKEKVPYLFGLCGHGIIGFMDVFNEVQDRLKPISVHHESIAAFMADAYYRVAHQPVATFTSCGPGSANLPVGLASAFMDSSAFLAITGNVPTSQWNRGPFQETGRYFQGDFVNVVRPYVKRSFQPTRAEMLPLALRQSFSLMKTGRPGPVHIDVPLNVFVETADVEVPEPSMWTRNITSKAGADPEAISAAMEMLQSAERPVIVAGHGVELAQAEQELVALAEKMGIPVATSPLGKGVINARHPLHLGTTGRNGSYAANAATRNADVILAIGTRFDDRSTSAWLLGFTYSFPPTKLIHVDIDPSEIGRNYPVDIGVLGDAKTVLTQLLQAFLSGSMRTSYQYTPWLDRIAGWKEKWNSYLEPHRNSEAVPIRPERFVKELRGSLPNDGILLSDVGVHHNWLVCEFEAFQPRSILQSWGFASMGFGIGGALGAKLAAPDRPVVAVCGDGGFLMMPSAVATAVQYDIPVVWIVWNNSGFCSIRDQQLGYFGSEVATSFTNHRTGELYTADCAAMARSMGASGEIVEHPDQLADRIQHAIQSGKPTLLDVRIDREIRPPASASWDLPPLPAPLPNFGWGED